MGQFLKGNNMGPIKIHNGGNYAHAQDSNAYNSMHCSKINSNILFTRQVFLNSCEFQAHFGFFLKSLKLEMRSKQKSWQFYCH